MTQGLLRAEAPLLLEIFAALFQVVDPKTLVDASSTATANLVPAQPSCAPQQVQQRHPRFGGMFVSRLEGGRARCSVGKAQHQDVLGHVAASGKLARTTMVRMSLLASLLTAFHKCEAVAPVGNCSRSCCRRRVAGPCSWTATCWCSCGAMQRRS